MSERKLASVQRIKALLPIPGADKIEIALILGWQVVVKKGEFMEDDQVYFFEIDSWIPHTLAPFLTGAGKEPKVFNDIPGERLKTVKLRKTLSQGLVLPIPDDIAGMYAEGQDVTEVLNIQKWEAVEKVSGTRMPNGTTLRPFPSFLKKTDQERIQNCGGIVQHALEEVFEATVKKDGSSCTVFRVDPSSPFYTAASRLISKEKSFWKRMIAFFHVKEPVFGICTRNTMLPLYGDSNFHPAAIPALMALHEPDMKGRSFAIQGEVVAPNIQDNHEKVFEPEFHAFDVFDIDRQEYMRPGFRQTFCWAYHIPHVTILANGKLENIIDYSGNVVSDVLRYAEGDGDNPDVIREGVVFKSYERDFSFKAVSNEYLLKTGK